MQSHGPDRIAILGHGVPTELPTVSVCSNGLVLRASAVLFSSSDSDTDTPSRTSAAAALRFSGVIRLSVPSSSFLPHRPQLEISLNHASNCARVTVWGGAASAAANGPAGPATVRRSAIAPTACPSPLTSWPSPHASWNGSRSTSAPILRQPSRLEWPTRPRLAAGSLGPSPQELNKVGPSGSFFRRTIDGSVPPGPQDARIERVTCLPLAARNFTLGHEACNNAH